MAREISLENTSLECRYYGISLQFLFSYIFCTVPRSEDGWPIGNYEDGWESWPVLTNFRDKEKNTKTYNKTISGCDPRTLDLTRYQWNEGCICCRFHNTDS
jgi:hypothetical protein